MTQQEWLKEQVSAWWKDETPSVRLRWFEYHCYEGEDSADAALWHRTHQPVTVIRPLTDEEADQPMSHIRFSDGFEADVFDDELLESPTQYERPDYLLTEDNPLNLRCCICGEGSPVPRHLKNDEPAHATCKLEGRMP